MSRLKRNVVANLIGNGFNAVLALALVPTYIRFMGVEAYGLVGVYTVLLTLFSLLDMGLSLTVNRELARLSTQAGSEQQARNLVRTVEVIYWMVACGIALAMILLVPLIATRWVHAQHLSTDAIRQALLAMSFVIALQFPFALYAGGLLGLQRQVLLNVVTVITATVRGLGAVAVLWLISPTIETFFHWQIAVTALQTGVTAILLWRSLPAATSVPRFRIGLLRSIWRFAGSIMAITVLGLLLSQLGNIILSKLLPLSTFGYYSVAAVVAAGLYNIGNPIYSALFPQFSRLVAMADEDGLKRLYHRSSQFMSVALIPVVTVVALFAPEILQAWTRNPAVVDNAGIYVRLLVIGTGLNILMSVPYILMLAHGWTKLSLIQNTVAVVVLVPAMVWAVSHYGGVGAASVWILLNFGAIFITVQIMHTRLLRQEKWRYYLQDILLPLAGALCIALIGRWLFPLRTSGLATIGALAAVSVSTLAGSALIAPATRAWLGSLLRIGWQRIAPAGRKAFSGRQPIAETAGAIHVAAPVQEGWLLEDHVRTPSRDASGVGPIPPTSADERS